MPHDILFSLVASSVSALVARTMTHPFDTLKTRVQYFGHTGSSTAQRSTSWSRMFLQSLRNGSFASLYKGLGVTLAFSVPATSLYLTAYDEAKSFLRRSNESNQSSETITVHALSGAFAESISSILWTPMEVIKSKLQTGVGARKSATDKHANMQIRKSTWSLVKEIYKSDGIRGFYRGYFLAQAVFVPYTMIYFVTYESLKQSFEEHEGLPSRQSLLAYVSCASIAGAVAGGVSNIVDVVKTRVQVSSTQSGFAVASDIWNNEGWRGFTKGMGARILWITPSMAISLTVYELLKDWRNEER